MPETRDTKQYKVYVLHANVEVVIGKKDGKDKVRTDRVAMAVFDDVKLCEKFQAENKSKLKGQKDYVVLEEWRESEPEKSHFNLPFNPKANAVTLTETKVDKKTKITVEETDETNGTD